MVISATETSSKMALNLFQKRLQKPGFCQKAQNLVYVRPFDFVQIPLACGTNIF